MLLTGNRKLQIEEVKRNPAEYYISIGEMCSGEQGETVCDAQHGKFCNKKKLVDIYFSLRTAAVAGARINSIRRNLNNVRFQPVLDFSESTNNILTSDK